MGEWTPVWRLADRPGRWRETPRWSRSRIHEYEHGRTAATEMRNRRRTGSGDPVFNPKRRIRSWQGSVADVAFGTALSAKVRYTGNPAHKRDPGDFKLTPPAAPRANATLCDDAGVNRRRIARALLRKGASKGLVDDRPGSRYPRLIWVVDDAGVVFEAQLENADRGEYHGYPMPLSDPLRNEVLRAARER